MNRVSLSNRNLLEIICDLFRDASLGILPKFINKRFFKSIDFAFIANLRNFEDIPSSSSLLIKIISKKFIQSKFNWPILGSTITWSPSNNIDKEIKGALIICPITAKQMVENNKLGRLKVFQSVRLAEKLGAKIVGLGAFTSIVTRDGAEIRDRFKLGVTTGNTYSATVAVQNLLKASESLGLNLLDSTVAIVGAAGSVGTGCSLFLVDKVRKIVLIDINIGKIKNLKNRIKSNFTEIELSLNIKDANKADALIVVTSAVGGIIKDEYLKPGMIVIDGAQPHNISKSIILKRKDVIFIESAIAEVQHINYKFNLGIGKKEVFGCLAELLILCSDNNYNGNFCGKVKLEDMTMMMNLAQQIGIKLAKFRNSCGYLLQSDFEFVKNRILKNKKSKR